MSKSHYQSDDRPTSRYETMPPDRVRLLDTIENEIKDISSSIIGLTKYDQLAFKSGSINGAEHFQVTLILSALRVACQHAKDAYRMIDLEEPK